jgi:hypothetical protein
LTFLPRAWVRRKTQMPGALYLRPLVAPLSEKGPFET